MRALLECPHCNGMLLTDDFIGRRVATMDNALKFHASAQCTSQRLQVQATVELLEQLIGKVAIGGDPAEVAKQIPWPNEEPPLSFCANTGMCNLGVRYPRRVQTLVLQLLPV